MKKEAFLFKTGSTRMQKKIIEIYITLRQQVYGFDNIKEVQCTNIGGYDTIEPKVNLLLDQNRNAGYMASEWRYTTHCKSAHGEKTVALMQHRLGNIEF